MKKTKIIVTLGPSTDDPKIIKQLIKAGTDVFRLNFSHGTHAEHIKNIKKLRKIEKESGRPIAILQDLQGPKIRVGDLKEGKLLLVTGKEAVLTIGKASGDEIPVQYKGIVKDVIKGDRVLLDDGNLELKVVSKGGNRVKCKVIFGGELFSKKGINLPDSDVSLSAFSKKDREDLFVGLKHDVDFVALSFVKTEKDIINLKKLIKSKGKDTKVIAKIERHEAVERIAEIIEEADGVMVARGDLGIEVSLDSVPFIQKDITKRCIALGKPVIVATQMLDSMIRNPRSTRAETSDIANAILDGADAVMLSGETSIGKYPINAVKAMNKIALAAEKWAVDKKIFIGRSAKKTIENTADAIAKCTTSLAYDIEARVIVNATASGNTTHALSKFRPHTHIISLTHTLKTARELNLIWGVTPYVSDYVTITDMAKKAVQISKDLGLVKKGDKMVIISGQRVGVAGGTNMIKVKEI